MPVKTYIKQGNIATYPVSNGKVRRNIEELIRRCDLSPRKILGNDGLLDDRDRQVVEEKLRRNPRLGIKIITL